MTMRAAFLAILLAAAGLGLAQAGPEGKEGVGIVLMHGKLGLPLGTSATSAPANGARLVGALKRAGYRVALPEMCWSRRRGFDRSFGDCLGEIDEAVAALRRQGATSIVVGGLSLGGRAAIVYGASHRGIDGVIGFGPADDPARKSNLPEIAAAIAKARALVQAGKGDAPQSFADVNTGAGGSYPMAINTTARIYLSFFDPEEAPSLGEEVAKLTEPLLWIAGTQDPTQRDARTRYFARAPANERSRFVEVAANHLTAPDAGTDAVLAWLAALAKP